MRAVAFLESHLLASNFFSSLIGLWIMRVHAAAGSQFIFVATAPASTQSRLLNDSSHLQSFAMHLGRNQRSTKYLKTAGDQWPLLAAASLAV